MRFLKFILIFFMILFFVREVHSEAKLKSWANDGFFNVYAEIELDGKLYRTDHPSLGPKMLKRIWDELDESDRRILMEKVYYIPNQRKAHFGEELSKEMTKWYNDVTGWTKAWEEFERRHAKKAFPELQAFFDNQEFIDKLKTQVWQGLSRECYDLLYDTEKYKEFQKLINQSERLFRFGQATYRELSRLQVKKVSAAVKGISKGLIELITDEILTPLITSGASLTSELIAEGIELGISTVKEGIDTFKDKIGYDPKPETVIKELSELIEMHEGLLKRVKDHLIENDQKIKSLLKQLQNDCEQNKRDMEKKEDEKNKKDKADPPVPVVVQVSNEEINKVKQESQGKTYKEIEEIALCEKVKQYHNRLMQEYEDKLKEYGVESANLLESGRGITEPGELKPCPYLTLSLDSPCLKMGSYTLKEIREYLKNSEAVIETYNRNKKIIEPLIPEIDLLIEKYREILVPLVKKINGLRINYRKCLGLEPLPVDTVRKIFEPLYNTKAHWSGLVRKYNFEIENYGLSIKVTKEGVKRRIDWIKNYSLYYDSYETNFKNSLYQYVDTVNKLNKLYEDEIFIKRISKWQPPQIDFERLKKIREEILKIQEQARRERELNRILDKLINLQEEAGRQIRRLVIAQGFIDDNYKQFGTYLENYSQGAIYSVQGFEKFKQDVAEVTMKQVKHPFNDIVKEITGNDPMLWRTEEDWILSASFFSVDFEKVINLFKGENEYYMALKELLKKIESEENQYAKLSGDEFARLITDLNTQANIILEKASIAGEAKPGSLVVQAYYDVMLKIRSIDEKYHFGRELQRVLQELQSHIEYHRNLLERNLLYEFENAINTAAMVIRQIDEKLRSHNEVVKLISELEKIVSKMKSRLDSEKAKVYYSIIQDFYSQFKSAYESRNDSLVMSFLGDSWSAGDGTTLADLQNNLRRTFKTFDEVRFNIQNLKIEPVGSDVFRISYDVTITSRIYKRNIKHEEKSSVVEEVTLDTSSKKAKISRTISGRFWYIK